MLVIVVIAAKRHTYHNIDSEGATLQHEDDYAISYYITMAEGYARLILSPLVSYDAATRATLMPLDTHSGRH